MKSEQYKQGYNAGYSEGYSLGQLDGYVSAMNDAIKQASDSIYDFAGEERGAIIGSINPKNPFQVTPPEVNPFNLLSAEDCLYLLIFRPSEEMDENRN
jgi:hypothetical protein